MQVPADTDKAPASASFEPVCSHAPQPWIAGHGCGPSRVQCGGKGTSSSSSSRKCRLPSMAGSTSYMAAQLLLFCLIIGLVVLPTPTRASAQHQHHQSSASSSIAEGTIVGPWWGSSQQPSSSAAGSTRAALLGSHYSPYSRQLLSQWRLLGLRSSSRLSGGVLQQLLAAAAEDDEEATTAAKAAASSQGRASRLLLTDLQLESASSAGSPARGGDRDQSRFLATAAQGPTGSSSQALLPVGSDAQPLCSATINYGASVGDASKKATADVPIYVGSFDVVITQPQDAVAAVPSDSQDSRWVLGWQFAAGEYLQMSRDVFGDDGIQKVFMSPSLQGPGADTDAEAPAAGRGVLGQSPQRVAVFSNTSLAGNNAEVVFSFVGRKGPEQPPVPNAPFRVAPPTYVFLNNHYCWPLFRPPGSAGNSPAAVAAAAGSGATIGRGSNAAAAANQTQQQQMVEVATPRLAAANMPRQLQVEYLPVEFVAESEDPALFAKTVTQFYFKITNLDTKPVFLDQLLLQYWFHGPLDGTVTESDNSTATDGSGVSDVVARVSASQFRLTCSDATQELGCAGLAWNVTPGLPSVFGARYVLNIWFPLPQPGGSNGNSRAQRYVLLPAGRNSSSSSSSSTNSSTQLPLQSVAGPDGKPVLLQPLVDMQAIVAIEPRRFFANISASNDYSFQETAVLTGQPPKNGSNAGDDGKLVRRRREPNTHMPAFIGQQLAWGSPPVGGRMAPQPGSAGSSSSKSAYPPGSYCQPSPGGGLVCGIDVLYCCLGSGPLNTSGVPPDWPQRLASGTNPTTDATMADVGTVNGSQGLNSTASATSSSALPSWGIALAAVLPALALVAAAAGGFDCIKRRRRRAAQQRLAAGSAWQPGMKPRKDSSTEGSQDGDVLAELGRAHLGSGGWTAAGAAAAGPGTAGSSSLYAALLSPQDSQQSLGPVGWYAAAAAAGGLDAAEQGQGPYLGLVQQQYNGLQPSGQQLGHNDSSQHSGSPLQPHAAGMEGTAAAAVAVAAARQRQILRVLKPKAPSLPGDMIAAAARFAKQQHLQHKGQQGPAASSPPGSPFARASWVAFSSSSSSDDPESDDDVRCHTWTGRLHEDAFEDDLFDQLLNLHMRPQLLNTALPGPQTTTDDVWQHLQQQQHSQPYSGAGAAAAAVEAAVAAINQLLSGAISSPPARSPGLSKYPPGSSSPVAGGDGSGSSSPTEPGKSSPSFYKALMATGGVLRPPGGPPIPLNVDFAAEIQPNLGRLLGRGGFGHVYEATWRGQRVAVKLLTVDTEDPAVLDAFLKEVALCACLRGCERVVRLLGACLGGCGTPPMQQSPPPPSAAGASTLSTASTSSITAAAAAAAAAGGGSPSVLHDNPSLDITPFQSQLPPDVLADDTPGGHGAGLNGSSNSQQPQQQQWALIMELVEGGNLAHRIYHPSKRSLSYLEILQIGLDIASGLAYLHPAVVHRDLKPQNVLLDRQGRAKIADFGISRFKDPHRSYLSVTHQGGTPNYMAPELFNASRVDEAADVYSLGCILYECLAKQQPFGHLAEDGKSFNVLYKIIVAVAINKERPLLPQDSPPRLASLILRCWSENPTARPRIDELLLELEDMMKEALHERAERTRRLSRISSRTQSLPNQPLHLRNNSTSSIMSNTSSTSGASSPIKANAAVRGARTMPSPGSAAPQGNQASSAAGASDGAAGGALWSLPGSSSSGQHMLVEQHSGSIITLPSSVVPLPSIGGAIAARASSGGIADVSQPAATSSLSSGVSLRLLTGAAAALQRQHSGCSNAGSQDAPSSPRPFHDQQLLLLQEHPLQQEHMQQHAGPMQQQQDMPQLGACTSLGSSVYSRAPWQCPCQGSAEPCVTCAGSSSSSDCGSSTGGCGSSGCSNQRTPTNNSPQLSPAAASGRHVQMLPQIPQDMPAAPLHLPGYAAAAAAAVAANDCGLSRHQANLQQLLQPHLLRPKVSVASPQTPARHAQVDRKPSHFSSQASGGLFSSEGSLPAGGFGPMGASSSELLYSPAAPAAATAYPALLYPLNADNMAAATAAAAAFNGQSGALLRQNSTAVSGASGTAGSYAPSGRPQQQQQQQQQQQGGGLPRQQSAAPSLLKQQSGSLSTQPLSLPSSTPASTASSHTSAVGGGATNSLARQRSGGLPKPTSSLHSRGGSNSSSSTAGGSVLRGLVDQYASDQLHQQQQLSLPSQSKQQQLKEEQDGIQQQQQQQGGSSSRRGSGSIDHNCPKPTATGTSKLLLHSAVTASGPDSAHARSSSSVQSEQQVSCELSSSLSSSPTAVPGSVAATSLYSYNSGISSSVQRLRSGSMDSASGQPLRSVSMDFGSTQLYNNPLFGLSSGADTWQPPLLQMQRSAPTAGASSRATAAGKMAAAAGCSLYRPASAEPGFALGGPAYDSSLHGMLSTSSGNTVFVTADTQAAAAVAGAAGAGADSSAAEAMGDFSIHRPLRLSIDTAGARSQADQLGGTGRRLGSLPSEAFRSSSSSSRRRSRDGGSASQSAAGSPVKPAAVVFAATGAAAEFDAGHVGGSAVAVQRKVSFADADEVLG